MKSAMDLDSLINDLWNVKDYIHESNLIEEINDKKYDTQGMFAWNYLKDVKTMDVGHICKVQKIITTLQDDLASHQRGYTRNMSKAGVQIAGKIMPSWFMVDALLQNWVLDLNEHWKTLDPIQMHIRYEHIHPFVDGNGRSGRMLLWWHELKIGRTPTLFLNAEKYEKYYPLFKKGKK